MLIKFNIRERLIKTITKIKMIMKIINFPIKAAKILVGITKTVIQVANTRTIKIATQIQISTMIKIATQIQISTIKKATVSITMTICKTYLKTNFTN